MNEKFVTPAGLQKLAQVYREQSDVENASFFETIATALADRDLLLKRAERALDAMFRKEHAQNVRENIPYMSLEAQDAIECSVDISRFLNPAESEQ